jgi:hypothetical protein
VFEPLGNIAALAAQETVTPIREPAELLARLQGKGDAGAGGDKTRRAGLEARARPPVYPGIQVKISLEGLRIGLNRKIKVCAATHVGPIAIKARSRSGGVVQLDAEMGHLQLLTFSEDERSHVLLNRRRLEEGPMASVQGVMSASLLGLGRPKPDTAPEVKMSVHMEDWRVFVNVERALELSKYILEGPLFLYAMEHVTVPPPKPFVPPAHPMRLEMEVRATGNSLWLPLEYGDQQDWVDGLALKQREIKVGIVMQKNMDLKVDIGPVTVEQKPDGPMLVEFEGLHGAVSLSGSRSMSIAGSGNILPVGVFLSAPSLLFLGRVGAYVNEYTPKVMAVANSDGGAFINSLLISEGYVSAPDSAAASEIVEMDCNFALALERVGVSVQSLSRDVVVFAVEGSEMKLTAGRSVLFELGIKDATLVDSPPPRVSGGRPVRSPIMCKARVHGAEPDLLDRPSEASAPGDSLSPRPHLSVRCSFSLEDQANIAISLHATDWTLSPPLVESALRVALDAGAAAMQAVELSTQGLPPAHSDSQSSLPQILADLSSDSIGVRSRARDALSRSVLAVPELSSVKVVVSVGLQQIVLEAGSVDLALVVHLSGTGKAELGIEKHARLPVVTKLWGSLQGEGLEWGVRARRNQHHRSHPSDGITAMERTSRSVLAGAEETKSGGHHLRETGRVSFIETPPSPSRDTCQQLVAPLCWKWENRAILAVDPAFPAVIRFTSDLHVDAIRAWFYLNVRDILAIVTSNSMAAMRVFTGASPGPMSSAMSGSAGRGLAPSPRDVTSLDNYLVPKIPIPSMDGGPSPADRAEAGDPTARVTWDDVILFVLGEASVRVDGVRLEVINNLCSPSLPLVDLSVSVFTLDAKLADAVLDGGLKLRSECQYLNRRLLVWEPLVEPWGCEVILSGGYVPRSVRRGLIKKQSYASLNGSGPGERSSPRRRKGSAASAGEVAALGLRSASSISRSQLQSASGTNLLSHSAPSDNQLARHLERNGGSDWAAPMGTSPEFLTVRVVTDDTVNINVTEVFLETISTAMMLLAKQSGTGRALEDGVGGSSNVSLYWIRNDSGVFLSYGVDRRASERFPGFIGPSPPPTRPEEVQRSLPSGQQEMLPPSIASSLSGRAPWKNLALTLQRPGQVPWPRLGQVAIEEEGNVQLHCIRPSSGEVLWVGCEVSVTGAGVRLLRVRSPVFFQNHCTVSLRLALKASFGVVQWEELLEPGAQLPLPIYLTSLESAVLLVACPDQAEGEERMTTPTFLVELPLPPASVEAIASAELEGDQNEGQETAIEADESRCLRLGDDCYVSLHVERDLDLRGNRVTEPASNQLRTLSFVPPNVLKNVLPRPLEYVIRSRKAPPRSRKLKKADPSPPGAEAKGVLKAGESFLWYASSDEDDLEVLVRVAPFDWSEPVAVHWAGGRSGSPSQPGGAKRLGVQVLELDLHDKAGLLLNALLEVHTKGRSRELTVYAPFWFVNATAYPLEFGHDPSTVRDKRLARSSGLIAGQHASSSLPAAEDPSAWANPRRRFHRGRTRGLLGLLPVSNSKQELFLLRLQEHLVLGGYSDDGLNPMARLHVRVPGGPWSRSFSFVAGQGLLSFFDIADRPLPSDALPRLPWLFPSWREHKRPPEPSYPVSVSLQPMSGAFHRTTVVTVAPQFVLVNCFGRSLEVQQDGLSQGGYKAMILPARSQQELEAERSFVWADGKGSRLLRVRLYEFGWEWSGKFSPESAGDTTLRLRNTNQDLKCLMQVGHGTIAR